MQAQEQPTTQFEATKMANFCRNLFEFIFYTQIVVITILSIFLTLRHFSPHEWFFPHLSSTACAVILSFLWQWFTLLNPQKALRTAFWSSPLLTCAAGVLLVSIGSIGSSITAVFALLFALAQSLYACWVSHRFDHATRILSVSMAPRARSTTIGIIFISMVSIAIADIFCTIAVSGIGGAMGTSFEALFVSLILLSLAWTTHVIKNVIQVTISRVKYMHFTSGIDFSAGTAFHSTVEHSIGSISIGSILVPIIGLVWGSARATSVISGDADEFMFSCADCCSGVASSLVKYGNRWGFVQVGVNNRGFVQASKNTWEMFQRAGMEPLINTDLTSSFCFLCGVASGAVCTLVGGSWALAIHKDYATEVSLYAFLIGYFLCRIAMAGPQACVSAHYVAYAENPNSSRFDSTITVGLQELQRVSATSQELQRPSA